MTDNIRRRILIAVEMWRKQCRERAKGLYWVDTKHKCSESCNLVIIYPPNIFGCIDSGVAHECGSIGSPCIERHDMSTGIICCLISGREIDNVERNIFLQKHSDPNEGFSSSGRNYDYVDPDDAQERNDQIEFCDYETEMQNFTGAFSEGENEDDRPTRILSGKNSGDADVEDESNEKSLRFTIRECLKPSSAGTNEHDRSKNKGKRRRQNSDNANEDESHILHDEELIEDIDLIDTFIDNVDNSLVGDVDYVYPAFETGTQIESTVIAVNKKGGNDINALQVLMPDFSFLNPLIDELKLEQSARPTTTAKLVNTSAFERVGSNISAYEEERNQFFHHIERWWSVSVQEKLRFVRTEKNNLLITEMVLQSIKEWSEWNSEKEAFFNNAVIEAMKACKSRFTIKDSEIIYPKKLSGLNVGLLQLFVFTFRCISRMKEFAYFWATRRLLERITRLESSQVNQHENVGKDEKNFQVDRQTTTRAQHSDIMLLQNFVMSIYEFFLDGWICEIDKENHKLIPSLHDEFGFPNFSNNRKRKRASESLSFESKQILEQKMPKAILFIKSVLQKFIKQRSTTAQFVYGVDQALFMHRIVEIEMR